MYQSLHFWDKIGHAESVGFRFYSAISRSESRISSSYLKITSFSLIYSLTYSRKRELVFWLSRGLNPLTCVPIALLRPNVVRDLKICTSWAPKFVTFRLVSAISRNETRLLRDILRSLRVIRGINRGYYMAAQRHEISLRVLKNISRVSAPFELFYDEFKVTICCKKTFCLC